MYNQLKITVLCILVCIPVIFTGQNPKSKVPFTDQVKQKTAAFSSHHDFEKARQYFLRSEWDSTLVYSMKELVSTPNDQTIEAYCHLFRGFSFYHKELFKEAQKEFLQINQEFDFSANVKAKLGSIALEFSEFEKAISYYKQVEKMAPEKTQTVNMSNVRHNLATCYIHLSQFDKAEHYLRQNILLHEASKDTIELIGSYGNLATLFYEQYKDDQAIPYFEKAYNLAITTNHFVHRKNTALNMAVVEENRKNFEKSIQYRKQYEQWKDSINNQANIYAVAQAERQIAVEKEQKQVALLKADNQVKQAQRNTLLYSAIILFVMFGVSLYFYREKVKRNHIINTQKEDLDALNATKDKLFSIVSHDLRSSVHAIKTSNKKLIDNLDSKNKEDTETLLQKNSAIVNGAYNLLDNLLNWSLLQTQQSFFEITKLRLSVIVSHVAYNYTGMLADTSIEFVNDVSKEAIVYADRESLKIILRNLIDNAIKFTQEGGKITIYTKDATDFYDLIVEDSGIGMKQETVHELLQETKLLSKKRHENILGTGLGLQLCKSMVKKNHGEFSIESELGKGTKMIVSLPKNKISDE